MTGTIGYDLLRTLKKRPLPATAYDVRDAKLKGFILRVRPSGTHSYMVEIGRGRRLTLGRVGSVKPPEARDKAEKAIGLKADGKDPIAERKAEQARQEAARRAERQRLTLGEYIETIYEPWAEAHQKRGDETITRLRVKFKPLLGTKLDDLRQWHVEEWKTKRLKRGITPKTINRDVSDLKALLARAVTSGHLAAHPLRDLKPEKIDRRGGVVRWLTAEEEARLRAALDDRDDGRRQARASFNAWRVARGLPEVPAYGTYTDHLTPVVLLALNTGLRRGELLALEWRDVDTRHALVSVRGETTKTGQTRHVELNTEAVKVLKQWKPPDAKPTHLVFPGPRGTTMNDVKTAWSGLLEDAKIERFRFHDLRHTFASKLVQRGVSLPVVQELLGHASIVQTQIYAHLAPAQRRDAVATLVAAS